MNTSKPLAKSLHTLTALVGVARHIQGKASADDARSEPAGAVGAALEILGYHADVADPHGIVSKAIAALG
jgi:hypothetical protein